MLSNRIHPMFNVLRMTQLYLSFKPVNATAQEEVVLAMQVYAGQVFI